jgi:uncharacterized protein YqhQ
MKHVIQAIVQGWLQAGEEIIVGGQAVIEGVLMRSPHAYAVAVRKKNGEIFYKGERVPRLGDKYPFLKLPILRGAATLIYSMALGIKTLNFSATVALEEETDGAANETPQTKQAKKDKAEKGAAATAAGSIIFALACNVLLFIVLPLLLTNALFLHFGSGSLHAATDASNAWYTNAWLWLRAYMKPVTPTVMFNFVDGLIRMSFFLILIYSFSRLKDIRRVFQYHGAEHKVVFAYEANMPLTIVNARTRPRQHPRCGTSFLMVVMLVATVMFSVVKFDSLVLNFLVRLGLIPVIAGIAYEIIRTSAKCNRQWLFKFITLPGLWLQNITTQDPDDTQLEVAIFALEKSLALEPASEVVIKDV